MNAHPQTTTHSQSEDDNPVSKVKRYVDELLEQMSRTREHLRRHPHEDPWVDPWEDDELDADKPWGQQAHD